MYWRGTVSFFFLIIAPLAGVAAGDAGIEFFEKKIRPVLVEQCYSCHSQAAKKRKGGLYLDSRAALRKGGDSGPAILPGKPEESLLVKAVRYIDAELRMPPRGKLPAVVIADLAKWVAMGAPDPRTDAAAQTGSVSPQIEEGRKFWAFQPPRQHPIPEVKDTSWSRGAIDRFILGTLESKGLQPAAAADRETLLRRAYFALVGLPPTPEQMNAFLGDQAPDAFVRVIDGLLASPHFGERWGRHWLDLARFAESSGGGRSLLLKDAWRYRDYVINAFNADKPYARFIIEQIAGDLLPSATPQKRHDLLVATAFLLLGPTNYERQNKPILEMDVIDEQLDTMGKAFLGMTIGCARCHDHKFDPIPTKDYYALAGIFKSTKMLVHANVSRWMEQPLPLPAEQQLALQKHEAAVAVLKKQIELAKSAAKPALVAGNSRKPDDSRTLEAELKHLLSAGPQRPMAMAVAEADKIEDCHVCIRGNFHNRGEKAPRGFLQVLSPPELKSAIPAKESGRRQLAEWLASPRNPLTARVMVNRIWHHLFGAGLVRTVDNFGKTGEPPSHPELLDYLALRFIEEGWSVKKLIREIMLSRTYQMSSTASAPMGRKLDPENRLLWHRNRCRLDAESLRDAMLAVSGSLDAAMAGPTIGKSTVIERDFKFTDTRRSVYTPIFRNKLLELFEVFDFADPNICMGRRNVSTVSTQALYLMNSSFVMDQASKAARALLAIPELSDSSRVDLAYRRALGRVPFATERRLALAFLNAPGQNREEAWGRLFQTLFACIDFRYVN